MKTKLQKHRERKGLTATALARESRVSYRTIHDMESGVYARTVQPRIQEDLARVLGTGVLSLFTTGRKVRR